MEIVFQEVITNGIFLNVAQAGNSDGELVLLLHGFPEFWYSWRRQIPALAEAGYRVWAPDQRGYNLSDKPSGVNAYKIETLAADVLGLMAAAGYDNRPCTIIGHDWGGAVAWWLAAQHPDRVKKLIILNAPHQNAFGNALTNSPTQREKSGYMFFFQQPERPEKVLEADDFAKLVEMTQGFAATPEAFTDEDIATYKAAWRQPEAVTGMLNWYRAMFSAKQPDDTRIKPPTLIIWGKADTALEFSLAEDSLAYCDAGRLTSIDKATHWVQHEFPDQVNRLILDFIASGD